MRYISCLSGRLKKLLSWSGQVSSVPEVFAAGEKTAGTEYRERRGMISRTCRICGKTFTLPGDVQYWPDCCQECRAKVRPAETITRTCRRCGKQFGFSSELRYWPHYCPECLKNRKGTDS